jgi:lycopene cyclase domain-containing protein
MWLYSIILLVSISIPLLLSFDKKVAFYRQWKYLFPAIFVVALVYIGFDVYLTKIGVWGFNPAYHLNILVFGLPLEELLFFIIVPYASIFLHDCLVAYFPKVRLPQKYLLPLGIFLIVLFSVLAVFNINKTYTFYILIKGIVAIGLSLFDKSNVTRYFYFSFLFILIPFIAVNGLLTGSFIENEVVWYNNQENLGIRVLTIPVEDFLYGFTMLLYGLMLREQFKKINFQRK